jgi:hypothetical protein
MTGQSHDLVAKLEQDVTDRTVPLADLLRTCIVLGGRTRSTRLSGWAVSELKGYADGDSVPVYRVAAAPIIIKYFFASAPYGKTRQETLNYNEYSLLLKQPIDQLEAIAAYSDAKGKPSLISVSNDIFQHYSGRHAKIYEHLDADTYIARATVVDTMEWLVDLPLIRGVLGRIRTALAEFVAELRAEAGDSNDVPTANQTDKAFQVALPAAVFTNSNVTIMTTGKGNIMPDDDRTIIKDNKTTIKGSTGNFSVASAKVTQINSPAIDLAKIREFADLMRQISPTLGFASDQETELQAVADDLVHVSESPVPEVGRIRRLLDGALRLLRTAGPSAAGKLAISMGDELIREIGEEVVRELPH